MKPLTHAEIEELRSSMAHVVIDDAAKDEIIRYLDAIVTSFVDQAFGFHPVQLSLSARANYAFKGQGHHANLCDTAKAGIVDLQTEGALNIDDTPEWHFAP